MNADIQKILTQIQEILNSILNALQVTATFLLAFLVVLWFTLCFWTFRDIQSRTRDIIAQIFATMLVVFFNIPGVLLYVLVRPKETIAQAYERSLQEEYMLQDLEEREICPTCRVKTQPDFQFCFNCRSRLRRECSNCTQLIKVKWASCPFCSTPQKVRSRESTLDRVGLGPGRTSRPGGPAQSPATTGRAIVPTGGAGNGLVNTAVNGGGSQGQGTNFRNNQQTQPYRNHITNKIGRDHADGGDSTITPEEQHYYNPTVEHNDSSPQNFYNSPDAQQPPANPIK